jgi:hypothetical protein
MVYDRTCKKKYGVGLSTAWSSGGVLYRGLRRLDATFGATSWDEALGWLATYAPDRSIEEIQYWGHGKWGTVFIDKDPFGREQLAHPRVAAIRERLTKGALVWLRTCEAFGARRGHDFAQQLADTLGARVAGHTFIIGVFQSGLHGLRPGNTPTWSVTEGLAEGTPEAPKRAHDSSATRPNTISCFHNHVPDEWFA